MSVAEGRYCESPSWSASLLWLATLRAAAEKLTVVAGPASELGGGGFGGGAWWTATSVAALGAGTCMLGILLTRSNGARVKS
jgi:hypothetical protein